MGEVDKEKVAWEPSETFWERAEATGAVRSEPNPDYKDQSDPSFQCPECHGKHFVVDPSDGERKSCSLCGPEARYVDPTPHPEAREDDIEIGTPREFAERLAWMTTNGKPDLDQWENHIKFRDAALSRLAAQKDEGMREALERSTYHLRRRLPQCGKQDMTNADRDLVEWCETDVPEIIRRAAPATSEKPEEGKR